MTPTSHRARNVLLALTLLPDAGCYIEARLAVADGGAAVDVPAMAATDHGSTVDAPAIDAPAFNLPPLDVPTFDVAVPDGAARRVVTDIAPGSCARLDDGSVWCWGNNAYGRNGDGTTTSSTRPAENPFLRDVAFVAMSTTHACALLSSATVSCWGSNERGESGGAPGTLRYAPRPVAGIADVAQLALGRNATCALKRDGSVWCWGGNTDGELGRRQTQEGDAVPQRIPGVAGAVQVAAVMSTVCARLVDGSLMCWGSNQNGSVGDGSSSYASPPVRVSGIDDAIDVGTGEAHSCALRRDGTAWCWGSNRFNQLGSGAAHLTPQPVPGVTGGVQLAVGQNHACVRLADGTVECWGTDNVSGTAMTWNGDYGPTPVVIAGTRGSVDLRASEGSNCVRFADGRAACWGSNFGELGDGTTVPRMDPVTVQFP